MLLCLLRWLAIEQAVLSGLTMKQHLVSIVIHLFHVLTLFNLEMASSFLSCCLLLGMLLQLCLSIASGSHIKLVNLALTWGLAHHEKLIDQETHENNSQSIACSPCVNRPSPGLIKSLLLARAFRVPWQRLNIECPEHGEGAGHESHRGEEEHAADEFVIEHEGLCLFAQVEDLPPHRCEWVHKGTNLDQPWNIGHNDAEKTRACQVKDLTERKGKDEAKIDPVEPLFSLFLLL